VREAVTQKQPSRGLCSYGGDAARKDQSLANSGEREKTEAGKEAQWQSTRLACSNPRGFNPQNCKNKINKEIISEWLAEAQWYNAYLA
jgi:hypothetical protein